ncbi:vegetative cell wall protein gp1-like [Tupaia chinensis]|uniref:vegetative cell wall protein gp1-like n=1 Tax=Tupaia chinensis TaxID=246437 RepID=UPI000FFB6762|nr:vegetative cell wall protein gp1-like [Tupaia chinensis]XP_027628867.1 vegetative cell wall protein gp1-like [Tupaia chinensis]
MRKPLLTGNGCVRMFRCLGSPLPVLGPHGESGCRLGKGGRPAKLAPGSFAKPASRGCPGIRELCGAQASAAPPQGPSAAHTLPPTQAHGPPGAAPTRGPQAPSLAPPLPPAAEAPDGGSLRSARGPQTPPGSSRPSLPPSQLLQQSSGPFLQGGRAPPQASAGAGARRRRARDSRGARRSCAPRSQPYRPQVLLRVPSETALRMAARGD